MKIKPLIVASAITSILSTPLLPMSAFGEDFNQCIERKRLELKAETQPFSIEGEVRCYGCKTCWIGGKPEHKKIQTGYNAPQSYTIVGDVQRTIISATSGDGGTSEVKYMRNEEGRVYRAYVDMWCKSENKIFGPGAWQHVKLTGNIQKSNTTSQDVLSMVTECAPLIGK